MPNFDRIQPNYFSYASLGLLPSLFLYLSTVYADARDRVQALGDFSFFDAYMSQPKQQARFCVPPVELNIRRLVCLPY